MPVGIGIGTGFGGRVFDPIAQLRPLARYRADFGITLNGSNVSAIANLGSASLPLSQGTGGAQPLFVAAGPNGHPYLSFDGGDSLSRADGGLAGNAAHSIVVIGAMHVQPAATRGLAAFGSTNTTGTSFIGFNNTPKNSYGSGSFIVTGSAGPTVDVWRCQTKVYTTADSVTRGYIGSTMDAEGAANAYNILDAGLVIGSYPRGDGQGGANGWIAEVIFFDRSLSPAERATIVTYSLSRYGV